MKKCTILIICIILLVLFIKLWNTKKNTYEDKKINLQNAYNTIIKEENDLTNKIDDWRLVLVNSENKLPSDFEIELSSIDKTREIDSRIISDLTKMIKYMRNIKYSNIWVQSAYRSIEYQDKLFNEKVTTYIEMGKSKEEAENLTMQTINKAGTSEHNLGLAVDFNYVDYEFENTKEFKWLKDNAEDYGFILRYEKEKEDITNVNYEPWHWRYVGVEHAKKMNELGMCLEEYIEYLQKGN